ncbi:MAG: SH3 domain-containing protein [Chloroflexi bacterium]|nr:MAG: SH3 domain-containing protein [Chloroflexota bacterium]
MGKQQQWLNVQAPNGVVGWVAAWFVVVTTKTVDDQTPIPGTPLLVYPIAQAGINIRATADAESMRLGGAVCGEPLTVIETDLNAARKKISVMDQWLYVQKSSGERGWVAAWFVGANPI